MTFTDPVVGRSGWIPRLGRLAAVVLVWLLVVGVGTACFFPPGPAFPPGASEDWAAFDNALVFGASMAIAGAIAAGTACAVGGKVRGAVEVIAAIMLATAILVAVAYTCLWLAPGIARAQMGYWEFERLRQTTSRWSAAIVRYMVPLGAVVGLLMGAIAGLLAVLARRRPRVAAGLMLGLLCAGAWEPVQRCTFNLVIRWGQIVRWWIVSPGMTDPFVPASGAILGAIAGALIMVVVLWRKRARPAAAGASIARE